MSSALVAFEDTTLGNAADELGKIGTECAVEFIQLFQSVQNNKINVRKLALFYSYRDVECFKATRGDCLTVYAVEHDNVGDRKVTVMFAGTCGRSMYCGTWWWDGYNFDALRSFVIHPRAVVWFV
jgi:hypothetical protein